MSTVEPKTNKVFVRHIKLIIISRQVLDTRLIEILHDVISMIQKFADLFGTRWSRVASTD